MDLVLNRGRSFSWRGALTTESGSHLTELENIEFCRSSGPSRHRFTEKKMTDIRAGRCFDCKKKNCPARNHDKKKKLDKQL